MAVCYLSTPIGSLEIKGDNYGICEISFVDTSSKVSDEIPPVLQQCHSELSEYFEGKRTDFNFNLNPNGTEFQRKVWAELMKVPVGKTISYLELSQKMGDVKAIRAVAAANGKNPLAIVIPCHRVIGKNGDLVGYAAGIPRKKWLLEFENPSNQISLFQ
ncbi:MAG: methylated-DNA--[protein]-cysteine S-methyltransferase [Flavobacteriaceae bacterium]|nr:methylated-DNA--[protein]-cysteine S-methyltransferase [Flavobacteriaceae bacterium]